MNKYGMFLRNGKDLINLTNQETKEEAIKFFAAVKKMPIIELLKLFVIKEIKNETIK